MEVGNMKFKRLTAAVLAVFLAAASAMETFAEEQTEPSGAVPAENTAETALALPDDLDFSQPGVTVRTGVIPDCTSIIFTVPKEKYDLYQQAYAETGRAGISFGVKLDDYYIDEWDDAFGTSATFGFFGGDGANGYIIECDCATDDSVDIWTGTTENGDAVGMLYGKSSEWVFEQAAKSVTCQFRYNILSAGTLVDGSYEYSTLVLRPGEEHDISGCKFKALPTVTYTGKPFTPVIEAEYEDRTLNEGYDYTVDYQDAVTPGIASVRITGINSFKGTKTLKFKILPPKSTLKGRKVKNENRATLTWSRPGGIYPNYEVQAAEGKGKFTKLADIQNHKLSLKVKWTSKSGCRFRIRPYITVGGKRIYGKWSNVVRLK